MIWIDEELKKNIEIQKFIMPSLPQDKENMKSLSREVRAPRRAKT